MNFIHQTNLHATCDMFIDNIHYGLIFRKQTDLCRYTTGNIIGSFEFKVEGRSKTAGTAEGCDFWDQNGVLLLHLRVQQQRKSEINELTMSDGIE